jgi:hypothetical protein
VEYRSGFAHAANLYDSDENVKVMQLNMTPDPITYPHFGIPIAKALWTHRKIALSRYGAVVYSGGSDVAPALAWLERGAL